jgi:hypothetical protein
MKASPTRQAVVWLGVIFVLGMLLGGMGGYALGRRSYFGHHERPTLAEKRAHKVEEMTRLLDLNSAQQHQVDEILADSQAQMKAVRKQIEPQLAEARQKGRERIRAVLTEEQKPKFEEFMKKLDEERKRREQ